MKKRQKSKMTMLIVGGLAAVSLVSVGFASWVASGVTTETTDGVDVTVGAVTNNSISVTIKDTSDLKLAFENVASPSGNVFTNDDSKTEKLGFRIDFEVNGNKSLYDKVNFVFSGALTDTKYSEYIKVPYTDALSKTIFYTVLWGDASSSVTANNQAVNPPSNVKNTVSYDSNNKKATFSANFYFGWGSKFNNDNPGNLNATSGGLTKEEIISRTETFRNLLAADIAANKNDSNPLLKVTIEPTKA